MTKLIQTLSQLSEAGIGVLQGADQTFSGVCTDTRTLNPGQLFVALSGEHFDGHDYLHTAIEKGACAVVVEKAHDLPISQFIVEDSVQALGHIAARQRQQFKGKVVGITGSCGKTTIKGMLQSILKAQGGCIATQGNFNNHIGVPLTLMRLDNAVNYAVVEAGASGLGEIRYLTGLIAPDVALISNIMPAHVEGFGSIEAIADEKFEIYGGENHHSEAVVNLDDGFAPYCIEKLSGRKVLGFSRSPSAAQKAISEGVISAAICAENIVINDQASASFDLACYGDTTLKGTRTQVHLSVLGEHNVANALAAGACAMSLGLQSEPIKIGLQAFGGDPGRMQCRTGINGVNVVDDTYNANPGSMRAAIDYLAQFRKNILICGDMGELGDGAVAMHEEIGHYAKAQGISQLYTTGVLAANIAKGYGEQAQHFAEQQDLIASLKQHLCEGALVLIKGSRSARMENIVNAISVSEEGH